MRKKFRCLRNLLKVTQLLCGRVGVLSSAVSRPWSVLLYYTYIIISIMYLTIHYAIVIYLHYYGIIILYLNRISLAQISKYSSRNLAVSLTLEYRGEEERALGLWNPQSSQMDPYEDGYHGVC